MSSSSADLQKKSFMKSPDFKELAYSMPSECGCKVVVQYMLLADIYVVCNCIFAADRLWRSGLYLHKRPLLLC